MRPMRVLTLLALVAAELVTLVAIVFVVRSAVGVSDMRWNSTWGISVGGPAHVTDERFLPLTSLRGALRISNDAGKVEVRTGNKDFGVRAVVHGYGWSENSAKESLKTVDITSSTGVDGARVEAKGPQTVTGQRPHADLYVTIPAGTTLNINAGMGVVDLQDLTGDVEVDASMGKVEVDGFKGNFGVNARMGSVDLRNMHILDKLDVQASMGSVEFSGRLGKSSTFGASMGSITLDLAANHPAIRLDADWSMGSLQNSLPFAGDRSEKGAEGVLGEGTVAGDLRIHASMGSIRIY